jgi:hypothetical protein
MNPRLRRVSNNSDTIGSLWFYRAWPYRASVLTPLSLITTSSSPPPKGYRASEQHPNFDKNTKKKEFVVTTKHYFFHKSWISLIHDTYVREGENEWIDVRIVNETHAAERTSGMSAVRRRARTRRWRRRLRQLRISNFFFSLPPTTIVNDDHIASIITNLQPSTIVAHISISSSLTHSLTRLTTYYVENREDECDVVMCVVVLARLVCVCAQCKNHFMEKARSRSSWITNHQTERTNTSPH